VAKPNYSFEKRQRELAKQKKKAEKESEKAARKRANQSQPDAEVADAPDGDPPARGD
jgi:hypothetical protein